jgi:hypothetical protein
MTNASDGLAGNDAPVSEPGTSVRALIENAEASGIKFEIIRRPAKTLNLLLNRAIGEHREQ